MYYSASELVKRSASQLLYNQVNSVKNRPTPRQFKGNEYAEKIVLKEGAIAEKRGVIEINDNDLLFFCIDAIKNNKLIEIKMIEDENNWAEWYLESSILQSTFYATLASKVKTLDTPQFRLDEGYEQEIVNVPDNFEFELWFGTKHKYKIFPDEKLYQHYLKKIQILKTKDFDVCKMFDNSYKFKEFKIFKPEYIEIV